MKNNEKFIKVWVVKRKNGKLKYILFESIQFIIIYSVIISILIVLEGNDLCNLAKYLDIFIIVLLSNTIGTYIRWNMNEEKYFKLLNNK